MLKNNKHMFTVLSFMPVSWVQIEVISYVLFKSISFN